MATLTPKLIIFEEISDLTLFPNTLLVSVNQKPFCWQSVIYHITNNASIYPQILQKNTDLQSRIELLEPVDKQLVQAQNQVQQNIREKRIYKQNIQNLIEQLCQTHINGTLGIPRVAKSATHLDLEKFNSDKTKLEAFLAQLNLKLQHNIDHFTKKRQKMEQNKLSYAISRLEGDTFTQIKPYVSAKNIDFENINQFVEVLKTCFGEVNPVSTAKYELYRL